MDEILCPVERGPYTQRGGVCSAKVASYSFYYKSSKLVGLSLLVV